MRFHVRQTAVVQVCQRLGEGIISKIQKKKDVKGKWRYKYYKNECQIKIRTFQKWKQVE
jgi:hypothetical protein